MNQYNDAKQHYEKFSAFYQAYNEVALAYLHFYSHILINPPEWLKLTNYSLNYYRCLHEISSRVFGFINDKPVVEADKVDKRFLSADWKEIPYFNFIKQHYLLNVKFSKKIIHSVELEDRIKRRLLFYNEGFLNTFSPSNFIYSNPEVIRNFVETGGSTFFNGFVNYLDDFGKGHFTQVDESKFELGKNLAVTPGAVVFRNELIELIQYSPSTKKVYQIPIILVPPWINKFYILDINPQKSFIKYLVDQGFTVYVISWRNVAPGMGYLSLDDYVQKGVFESVRLIKSISKTNKVNALGYCLGGTLLSIATSILNLTDDNPIQTITLLAAMVDFSDYGPMGDIIDDTLIDKLERGEYLTDDVMSGHEMERVFDLLKSNDSIWTPYVNNYLKGMDFPAFDIMFWKNDNTNLPAKMYVYYMKEIILKNKLSRRNALKICNHKIDISNINIPVYVVAMENDNISPPQTCFISTELVSGPVEFMLAESGHVIGAINPPGRKKYGHYINGNVDDGYSQWKSTAKFVHDSWWVSWTDRIKKHSGPLQVAPEKLGNDDYPELEKSPGTYVKERLKC